MVMVAERAAPMFALTSKLTVPLPLPVDPDPIVIHEALLDAVHAQPAAAVTLTGGPAPAPAPMDVFNGLIAYEQLAAGTAA